MSQQKLCSVIIIAKNEEDRIGTCLRSVAWADTVIVVNNNSSDDTAGIAKKAHAVVVEAKTGNFSELRTIALPFADSQWLLYVDADEELPEPLINEIQAVLRNKNARSAYFIRRHNYYLGHEWPECDRMIRLIQKNKLIHWEGALHEHPVISGSVGELGEPLIHRTHRILTEMVEKTNVWSETEADLRVGAHHPPIAGWRILRVMITAFWDSYIRQKGWRAGTIGLIESIYQSLSMFITYAKVWERQNLSRQKHS